MQQPEVNASSVIEETTSRPARSFWSTLTQSSKPAELQHAPLEITAADFAGYISQVKQARKRAGLPELSPLHEEEAEGSEAGAGAVGAEGGAAAADGSAGAPGSPAGTARRDAFSVVPAEFFDPSKLTYELNSVGLPARDKNGEPILELAAGVLEAHLASHPSLNTLEARMVDAHDRVLDDLHVNVQGRAPQFFLALREMEDLQQRVVAGSVVATSLRRHLQRLKHENCTQPLAMIAHHRRRRRKASILQILRQVKDVLAMPAAALRHLHSGQQGAALDTVLAALAITRGPLAHLVCLDEARRRLETLQQSIGKQLIQQLTRVCLSIVVIGAEGAGAGEGAAVAALPMEEAAAAAAAPGSASASALDAAASPRYAADAPGMALEVALQTSVRPLLEGLVRLRVLGEALESVQVGLISELKEVVRSEVREAVLAAEMGGGSGSGSGSGSGVGAGRAGDEQLAAGGTVTMEGSSAAAAAAAAASADRPERLQALSPPAFVAVVTSVSSGLLDVLRRLQALHELVERVLDMSSDCIAPSTAEAGASTAAPPSSSNEGSGSSSDSSAGAAPGVQKLSAWESIDLALGLSLPQAAASHGGALAPASRSGSSSAAHFKSLAERTVEVQRWRAMASAVLKVATDGVQRHISRLIAVRREQSMMLRVSDMRRLWDAATFFTSTANSILSSASSAAALSLTSSPESYVVLDECLAQVKGLLAAMHSKNSATLSALMDAEQWKQAEVPRQVQRIADAIASAVSASPVAGSGGGGGGGGGGGSGSGSALEAIQRATEGEGVKGVGEGSVLFSAAPDSASTLHVGGVGYPIVTAAVMLIKMLGDYSNVTESFHDCAADAIACTVQLLRSFNTRAHELILEAGASKQKGGTLNKITAKHLALTSQSLGAVLSLLPALRALLLMRLAPHQHMLLSDLAAVTADLLAHDSKIRAKLVAIVKELMAACCLKMRAIAWGNPNAAASIPSTPMTEFITGTTTLHGILMTIFRREQVADVYSRTLLMVNSNLPGHYAVLIAHLATTAAAAAAAAAQPAATGAGARAPGAPSPPQPPPFDRAVALQRMGADLRLLLEQFRSLLQQPQAPGAAAAAYPAHAAAEQPDAEMAASILASQEALQMLTQWMHKEFGAGSSTGSPPKASPGAAAAAAAAAATDAATEAAAAAASLEAAAAATAVELEEEEEEEGATGEESLQHLVALEGAADSVAAASAAEKAAAGSNGLSSPP